MATLSEFGTFAANDIVHPYLPKSKQRHRRWRIIFSAGIVAAICLCAYAVVKDYNATHSSVAFEDLQSGPSNHIAVAALDEADVLDTGTSTTTSTKTQTRLVDPNLSTLLHGLHPSLNCDVEKPEWFMNAGRGKATPLFTDLDQSSTGKDSKQSASSKKQSTGKNSKQSASSKRQSTGKDSSMCSSTTGKGCETCKSKSNKEGTDYYACMQCRDKNICSPKSTPEEVRPPQCDVPSFASWNVPAKQDPVKLRCQAYTCNKAGLNAQGRWNPTLPISSSSSSDGSSLSTEPCCAEILKNTKTDCHNLFGCTLSQTDVVTGSRRLPMQLDPKLSSCKAKLCQKRINGPSVWSQKKNLAIFDGDGSYQCCVDLLESNKGRLSSKDWCSKPTQPIMGKDQCVAYLCERKIKNSGDSYQDYLEAFRKSSPPKHQKAKPKGKSPPAKSASRSERASTASPSSTNRKLMNTAASDSSKSEAKPASEMKMVKKCIGVLFDNQLADWSMEQPCVEEEEEKEITEPSPSEEKGETK